MFRSFSINSRSNRVIPSRGWVGRNIREALFNGLNLIEVISKFFLGKLLSTFFAFVHFAGMDKRRRYWKILGVR